MKNDVVGIIVGVAVVAILVSFTVDLMNPTYGFFAKVDAGHVGIVTHFGKIEDKVLQAGFHLTGFFEKVHPVNIRTTAIDAELVAFSSDIQQVTMNVTVNYNVSPESANTLYRTVGKNYVETILTPRLLEDAKVVVSRYTAEQLVANRNEISSKILELMQNDIAPYGIVVSAISVKNIDFTDAFEAAVEAKQVATQDAQRAKTVQEQQTMETQQEANRKKIEADAKAYSTKVNADAEAEANKKISESITPELIDYIQAKNWNGKLPGTYLGSGTAIPIIPTNSDGGEAQ